MGAFTECPTHGKQNTVSVCTHIWEDLQNNTLPNMKALTVLHMKVCNECYHLTDEKSLENLTFNDAIRKTQSEQSIIEEKLYRRYEIIEEKRMCIECFKRIQLINARKNGKPLPFEPFENTLMYEDLQTIEKLESEIKNNFDLPKFQNPYFKGFDAFLITNGAISYPLKSNFWYITKEEEQEKILKFIDNFFISVSRKQRRIIFYEKENWIKEGNSEYRGKEKILLEKFVG